MDRKLYYQCLNDKDVIKLGELQGRHFLNKENDIDVLFIFIYRGFPQSWYMADTRIVLEVYKNTILNPAIPKTAIGNETLILVHAETMDFAILFKLTINSENREVKVIMVEPPDRGLSILTQEETEGLIVPFPT